MAGRRLLDAAAFFKAVRGVAAHSQSLQTQRLERYSKTSSLAKAIKDQTDRVTLTVKAAAALNDRLNTSPSYSTKAEPRKSGVNENSIPAKEPLNQSTSLQGQKSSSENDHFYHQSPKDTTAQPTPDTNLQVRQEQAAEIPLPDGTIPPKGANVVGERREELFSQVPGAAPPKRPLDEDGEGSLEPQMSGKSSIPRPADSLTLDAAESQPSSTQGAARQSSSRPGDEAVPKVQAVPEQEPITEDMYSEIFQSPRIAKLLRNDPKKKPGNEASLPGARREQPEPTKDPRTRDQDTYNSPIAPEAPSDQQDSLPEALNSKTSEKEDFETLGKDLASDSQASGGDQPTVSFPSRCTPDPHADQLTDP